MQFARKWGRQRGAARRKGTGRVTAGSELPLGLAESLGDAAWDSEIKPGNSCGNLGSDCRSAAQLRLPAACRANWEHLLQASWEQRGDWRGRRRELSPLPAPNLPPAPHQSVPGWFGLSCSSPRKEEEPEAWYRGSASPSTHRALVGRVSTGLGSTVLSDTC